MLTEEERGRMLEAWNDTASSGLAPELDGPEEDDIGLSDDECFPGEIAEDE
jgi:hypothetical protein